VNITGKEKVNSVGKEKLNVTGREKPSKLTKVAKGDLVTKKTKSRLVDPWSLTPWPEP